MSMNLVLKAGGVWLFIVIVAIANGLVRETFLVPALGQPLALPVSGISLSVLVFVITYAKYPVIRSKYCHCLYIYWNSVAVNDVGIRIWFWSLCVG